MNRLLKDADAFGDICERELGDREPLYIHAGNVVYFASDQEKALLIKNPIYIGAIIKDGDREKFMTIDMMDGEDSRAKHKHLIERLSFSFNCWNTEQATGLILLVSYKLICKAINPKPKYLFMGTIGKDIVAYMMFTEYEVVDKPKFIPTMSDIEEAMDIINDGGGKAELDEGVIEAKKFKA